ncbi:hypothetical protein [uncultured Algimonas sp.]|uniref:hypothetical protein n=1 Tax=uncultured Algimonas sp. TaxID=1547920 RepID=UPI0026135708|nr:hypothetical protein [uncultured Algimonas sp.]
MAWPAIDTPDDLKRLRRFQRWNLAPWVSGTGGRVLLPEVGEVADPDCADTLLLWNQAETIGAPRDRLERGLAVDPLMDISASDTLNRWVATQLGEGTRAARHWPRSVSDLRGFIGNRPVLIVGSGPQTAEARQRAIRDQPVPVILGSALADTDFVDILPPGLVVCADGAGQFGATPAAQQLIGMMAGQLRRGAHLVVPEELGPLARHALGEIAPDRIHSVPMGGGSDALWRNGQSRPLGNVLTTLGLPVAATIVVQRRNPTIDTIGISLMAAGSEGSTHWAHRAASTLLRRKATDLLVQEPGSVLPVDGYLDRHYSALDAMIGELNADAVSVTASAEPIYSSSSDSKQTPLYLNAVRRLLASFVETLDWLEATRHGMAVMIGLSIAVLAVITGLQGTKFAAVAIALTALLLSLATAVFLRLRMRRWQHIFERRRRLIEARGLELMSERLAAVEDRLDALDDHGPRSTDPQ